MPNGCRRGRVECVMNERSGSYATYSIPRKDRKPPSQIDMSKECSREMVYCDRFSIRLMRGACARRWEGAVTQMITQLATGQCEGCEIGEARYAACRCET